MTANELRDKFNREFGLNPWPKTYTVDAATYVAVQTLLIENTPHTPGASEVGPIYWLAHGPNGGLMFKNVELLLEVK